MTVLVVLETVVLAVLVVLVSGLLRSHAMILRRFSELGIETAERPAPRLRPRTGPGPTAGRLALRPAPDLTEPGPSAGRLAPQSAPDLGGVDLDGSALAIRVTGVGADTLLIFLSSGCATCGALWEALADPNLALPPGTRLIVVTQGADREQAALLAGLAPPHLPLVLSSQAWQDYGVPGAPYAVLVDGTFGRVAGEATAHTLGEVLALLGRTVDDGPHRSAPTSWS